MQTSLLILVAIVLIYFLIREMKRNLTEESFISIVNHTFRTPLTRIKWMSEKLSGDIPRKEQEDIARDVSNSVNRLLEIIDTLAGIKNINSRASYELKAVSIREILEQAVAKYRAPINEKKIVLSMPSFNDMPLLSVDTKKISFVIDVILENAILYSKENGNVKIEAGIYDNNIIISIKDEGIGLSWKDRRNVFDKFYRGEIAKKINTDGMGLGLYISREIVKRHGGKIYAKSQGRNKGSAFYIKLPSKS